MYLDRARSLAVQYTHMVCSLLLPHSIRSGHSDPLPVAHPSPCSSTPALPAHFPLPRPFVPPSSHPFLSPHPSLHPRLRNRLSPPFLPSFLPRVLPPSFLPRPQRFLIGIVLFTIAFEKALEWVEEQLEEYDLKFDESYLEMLQKIKDELMILGFVSFNLTLLEEILEGKIDETKSRLFEFAHLLVFFIASMRITF